MRAIVLGATGLIGGLLLERLLADPVVTAVKVIGRRPLGKQHPKLQEVIIDFNDAASFSAQFNNADCVCCCVGTTRQLVKGNKEAYRRVDFDIPVHAAQYAVAAGVQRFMLVSSVGANASSGQFYLRLKGETEQAVLHEAIPAIYIMRPSMLLGKRHPPRFTERMVQPVMQGLSFFLRGRLAKYKAIQAKDVAAAILHAVKQTRKGHFIWEYNELMKASSAEAVT